MRGDVEAASELVPATTAASTELAVQAETTRNVNIPSSNVFSFTENDNSTAGATTSATRLYLMVLSDFGLAFTWVLKFALTTPYFAHALRAGALVSHLVWVLGPLSGLIVAPVVGALSDSCTSSYGRRRPFMLGGMLSCLFGMFIFSNAKSLSGGSPQISILIAVIGFAILDFASNAIMFPSRALLGDLLPPHRQHDAQSAAAVVASVAEITAGIYVYSWKEPVTHIARIFGTGCIVLVVTTAVSLVLCKETPLEQTHAAEEFEMEDLASRLEEEEDRDEEAADMERQNDTKVVEDKLSVDNRSPKANAKSFDEPVLTQASPGTPAASSGEQVASGSRYNSPSAMSAMLRAIRNFPRELIKVGIVYSLAWFCWFACLPFFSQWLGVDVMGGDPHAAPGTPAARSYQFGVNVFSVANVVKACTAIIFSAMYPRLLEFVGEIGERVVFSVPFVIFGTALYFTANTKNVWIAAGVIALGSVPFIATQTIPVAIVVQRFPHRIASNLGILNLFCVVPQLIDTLYTGPLAVAHSESMVMRVAACWAFAAAIGAAVSL